MLTYVRCFTSVSRSASPRRRRLHSAGRDVHPGVYDRAGFRAGQTGHMPRATTKKGPHPHCATTPRRPTPPPPPPPLTPLPPSPQTRPPPPDPPPLNLSCPEAPTVLLPALVSDISAGRSNNKHVVRPANQTCCATQLHRLYDLRVTVINHLVTAVSLHSLN